MDPKNISDITAKGEEFRIRMKGGLSAGAVKRLSALSPLRATLSLLESWGIIAFFIIIGSLWPEPVVILISIIGIAAGQHGLAILSHQSAHYRMYKSRRLNDLAGSLCAMPLGVSMKTYRIIHRIHHNHLYESIDPDLALMAGYPRGRAYLLKKLLKDLIGITTIKNYLYFFGNPSSNHNNEGVSQSIDDTSPALKRAAKLDRIFVVIFQIGLLALFISAGLWREYLIFWALPLLTVLQVILRLRAVCEHGAVTDISTPMRAARTTLAPFWVQWILFPHRMHYHIEHHLYPSVPHYRLPECHRILVEAGLLKDAEVVSTFSATLKKIFADKT
jgi:fatty acid desaturase